MLRGPSNVADGVFENHKSGSFVAVHEIQLFLTWITYDPGFWSRFAGLIVFEFDRFEMTVAEATATEKVEQPKTLAQKVVSTTAGLVKDAAVQAGIAEKTPFCPDHQVAMQKKASKFGEGKFFWSCPVKLDDGKYCRAKPQ